METENKVGLVLWIIQERTAGQTGRRGLFTGGSSHRGDPAGGSGSAPALSTASIATTPPSAQYNQY